MIAPAKRPPNWLQAIRSALFNLAMYVASALICIVLLPLLLGPMRWGQLAGVIWSGSILVLLKLICGLGHRVVGREHLPAGACIVAPKHHSTWETMAIYTLVERRVAVLKRELTWIPLFGWFTIKGKMIAVDRGAGSQALAAMTKRAREVIRGGRQLFIFPEGTRRAAGAEPRYKFGVAHLYDVIGVPCVPVALNSGLFWPRRSLIRLPGTIVVEFLEPIPPGLDKDAFFSRMQDEIETATARLVAEGEAELKRRGLRADP
jgi:1-acyl-sn-glycerol-3-phosphate acyltransferase